MRDRGIPDTQAVTSATKACAHDVEAKEGEAVVGARLNAFTTMIATTTKAIASRASFRFGSVVGGEDGTFSMLSGATAG